MGYPDGRFYGLEKIVYNKETHHLQYVFPPEDKLFVINGRVSKYTPDDLPKWYMQARIFKCHGFIRTTGVKDMVFKPSNPKYNNHILRDCSLYVSYDKKIEEIKNKDNTIYRDFKGYFCIIDGYNIITFLKMAKVYSKYDISKLKKQVIQHMLEYKKHYGDDWDGRYYTEEEIRNIFNRNEDEL